ncbi:LicD family protein [Isoptericola sp. NPDC055881]
MSIYRSARERLGRAAGKARAGRGRPDPVAELRSRRLLDDYEVAADLVLADGKVPVNYFTFRPSFGDALSPWLVGRLTGRATKVADRTRPHYAVIGSVISQGTDETIFWGTGAYGTEDVTEVPAGAAYTAVRGPLTRAKLSASKGFGIPVPAVYGDPALLLPLVHAPQGPVTHDYGVVVSGTERRWAEATYGPGVLLIDAGRVDVEAVLRDLLSCRRIVSSVLHGLVVADAYGIPNAWLESDAPRGGAFPFHDYFGGVQKLRAPHRFDPAAQPVTRELLEEVFTFSDEAIRFDHRAFLDASPLLHRTGAPRRRAERLPRREPSDLLRQGGTRRLLPSLGYFGGIGANYLPVRFAGPVSEIRFSLPRDGQRQLDLRGLELFRRGKRVEVDLATATVAQSSDVTKDDRSPFGLGGIRTARETGPWWTVRFDTPVDADEVRVFNRLDGYGVRTRALSVAVGRADAGPDLVVTVDSDRVVRQTLELLSRLTGQPVDESVLASPEAAGTARAEVLARLAQRAREGLLTTDATEQRLLASLLPTDRLGDDEALSDDEWALLGHLLAAERYRAPGTATSMRAFQFVLRSKADLHRLGDEVNRAGEVLGAPRAVLTRHGIVDVGGLREQSDGYIATIEHAAEVLEACGYPTMLAYGTLLGAVREGDFLAHDDDVDLMVPLQAADRAEGEPLLADLRRSLQEKGWRVSRPNSYTNFHLHDPQTKLHVDVFPLFVDGATTSLHMEKMQLRTIDTDIVLPPRTLTFKGHELLVPARPEAFLAERYGDGWSVADPFYDWPWALRD